MEILKIIFYYHVCQILFSKIINHLIPNFETPRVDGSYLSIVPHHTNLGYLHSMLIYFKLVRFSYYTMFSFLDR